MILKCFSVFDAKAECYYPPFFNTTAGLAIRQMENYLRDPNHQFSRSPSDFTLFELGEYDDGTGMFKNHDVHKNLGVLVQFQAQSKAS